MKNSIPQSQIVIYKTEDGQTKIDVRFENETVWLTQNALADLFQTTKQNISQHINNIFEEGELQSISVVKDFLTTASDGKNYVTNYEPSHPTGEIALHPTDFFKVVVYVSLATRRVK